MLLRLACWSEDPGPECVNAPIVALAGMHWDGMVEPHAMQAAWKKQQILLGLRPRWSAIAGPASSCLMQARELEWTWPAWHTFITRDGLKIDVRIVCPRDVEAMARKDCEAVTWATWVQAKVARAPLAPAPLLEPVQRWFRGKKWGPGPAAAAQAVTAGLWTQSKAFQHGVAEHPNCLACLARGLTVEGTSQHRLGSCKSMRSERLALPERWQHQIETSPNRWLWDRGLLADPTKRHPFKQQPEETRWNVPDGEEALFTGDVATDGSRIGNWRDLGCTGMAAAQLAPGGTEVTIAAWGPLPVDLPVQRKIARAELFAVLLVLRACLPPVRIHVDCSLILKGVEAGHRWCTYSRRPHADVWRMIWTCIDDIGLGEDGASFYKVKAHASRAHIAAAAAPMQRILIANGHADELARKGALVGVNEFLHICIS